MPARNGTYPSKVLETHYTLSITLLAIGLTHLLAASIVYKHEYFKMKINECQGPDSKLTWRKVWAVIVLLGLYIAQSTTTAE